MTYTPISEIRPAYAKVVDATAPPVTRIERVPKPRPVTQRPPTQTERRFQLALRSALGELTPARPPLCSRRARAR